MGLFRKTTREDRLQRIETNLDHLSVIAASFLKKEDIKSIRKSGHILLVGTELSGRPILENDLYPKDPKEAEKLKTCVMAVLSVTQDIYFKINHYKRFPESKPWPPIDYSLKSLKNPEARKSSFTGVKGVMDHYLKGDALVVEDKKFFNELIQDASLAENAIKSIPGRDFRAGRGMMLNLIRQIKKEIILLSKGK